MSVVVAHQISPIGRLAVQEAAREAGLRKTPLVVVHVPEGVDVEIVEEQKATLRTEIAEMLQEVDQADVDWNLQVATGADVAETVLDLIADTDVDLLVIGARRRSAVGKLIMGSVTQTIILRAEVPVLVVKPPARSG
jgi:nucleotide-binding universal stress UspA family protein